MKYTFSEKCRGAKNLGKYAMKGTISPMKGKKHTAEALRKMSINHPRKGNHYWLGKKMPLEMRKKLSLAHKGKMPKNIGLLIQNIKINGFQKGENIGEKNPNWKGGISSQNKNERKRFRDTMQKAVFERDNYTCQLCGSTKDLQVDHIQSWAEYVELRFKMENCRTLCAKCHYEITFGRPMPKYIKRWGHNLMKGAA